MWDTVIGLETHVQLSTNPKFFRPFQLINTESNSLANFIDAGS